MGLDPTNEVTPTYLYTWVIIALNAGGECSQRRFFFYHCHRVAKR